MNNHAWYDRLKTSSPLPCGVLDSSGLHHENFYSEHFLHSGWWGCLNMRDVFGILEGHYPTRFVSITYSPYHFQRSFILTTWNHPLFPHAVRGEYCVRRGWSGQCVSRLQFLVRKDLDLCYAISGRNNFMDLVVSTRGSNHNHWPIFLLTTWPFIGGIHNPDDW